MAMTTKQIGGVEVRANSGATSYSIEYFVLDSDLESCVPEIGDIAAWAPEPATVSAYAKSWYGPGCWRLTITAERQDGETIGSSESLADETVKSYSVAELYFPRQWWGIRLAGAQDAGYADDGSGGMARTEANAVFDINGNRAETGALLFPGASKDSVGVPDYALSPFSNSTSTTMPVSLVEQKVKTKTYTIGFYTKKAINAISNFVGVSGEFAGVCRPSPSGAGKWRADFQSLDTVKDSKGKSWIKVFRRMTMAPGSLAWAPSKNGGTWSW